MATLKREERIYFRPDGIMALTWAVKGPAGAIHLQVNLRCAVDGPETWLRGGPPAWSFHSAFVGRHAYVPLGEGDEAPRDDCDVLPGPGDPPTRCYFSALDSYGEELWRKATDQAETPSVDRIWSGLTETYGQLLQVEL